MKQISSERCIAMQRKLLDGLTSPIWIIRKDSNGQMGWGVEVNGKQFLSSQPFIDRLCVLVVRSFGRPLPITASNLVPYLIGETPKDISVKIAKLIGDAVMAEMKPNEVLPLELMQNSISNTVTKETVTFQELLAVELIFNLRCTIAGCTYGIPVKVPAISIFNEDYLQSVWQAGLDAEPNSTTESTSQ